MNKETRTWLTGVLIFFVSLYGISEINFDKDKIWAVSSFFIDLLFISYGFSLILKTIDK